MTALRQRHPRLSVELQTVHHDEVLRRLLERDCELALVYAPATQPRVRIQVLEQAELMVLARQEDFPGRPHLALADLQTVDLFVITWGAPGIAHTIASFGFGEAGHVSFSIETRKEKGEGYSAIKGFFRQYEKIYVVADEQDVIRLRTNVRREKVYLYPLKVRPALARSIFLDYLRELNRLRDRPQWYNALIANCTTSVRQHVVPYTPDAWLDWRLVVNGFIDRLFYERGLVNRDLPFAELKARSLINEKALAADTDPDFSRRIREGLPPRPPLE